MPINIPDGLPAKTILHQERIFALEEEVASHQHIRPLRLAILNLMPTKIETETQILRLISKSPLQVSCDFMRVSSHESKNTSQDHLVKFYDTFDVYCNENYDGLIVTGAPVEHLGFEEVDYWDELCQIMDWSREHVFSTMFLCWGAMAGLYHFYGIPKRQLPAKLFGVFPQRLCDEYSFLTNGFDEMHNMPHSRHAMLDAAELAKHPELNVLSEGLNSGPALIPQLAQLGLPDDSLRVRRDSGGHSRTARTYLSHGGEVRLTSFVDRADPPAHISAYDIISILTQERGHRDRYRHAQAQRRQVPRRNRPHRDQPRHAGGPPHHVA